MKKKKNIDLEEKRVTLIKPRVTDHQGIYHVDVSSIFSTLPLDSIICGDALDVLQSFPDNFVDLVVTSPPYADKRENSYGGITPDRYVQWFLPISKF